jgi:hypothetical protein
VVDSISDNACGDRPKYQCVRNSDGGYDAQHFYLAHIEFDDMGEMWSIGNLQHGVRERHSQLESALAVIEKAQKEATVEHRELIVITYVHGWHNNASPYDEENKDLGSFKSVLQDFSAGYSMDYLNKSPIVVGVFLSWRGQAVAENRITTYWNRRDAANRVGGASLTEVVTRLMFKTKGVPIHQDRCESFPQFPTSHFVVIGHSFGARALEQAIAQPMLSLILQRQAEAQACIELWNEQHKDEKPLTDVTFLAPADLVVFLNAANDAFDMKKIVEAMKRSDLRVLSDDMHSEDGAGAPFLISVTSDGDWATEDIMPVAQWFSTIGLAFRKYDHNACKEGQLSGYRQSYFYRHSAASIKEMRSHTVVDNIDMNSLGCKKASESDAADNWPFFTAVMKNGERCFEIRASEDSWNDTPAFIIGVPKSLIPGHTDIFQDGAEELLIAIANHYGSFKYPARIRTLAKPSGR